MLFFRICSNGYVTYSTKSELSQTNFLPEDAFLEEMFQEPMHEDFYLYRINEAQLVAMYESHLPPERHKKSNVVVLQHLLNRRRSFAFNYIRVTRICRSNL